MKIHDYAICSSIVNSQSYINISANCALIFVILIKQFDTLWMLIAVEQTCWVCINSVSIAVPGTIWFPTSSETTLRVILQFEHSLTVTCVGGGGGGGR